MPAPPSGEYTPHTIAYSPDGRWLAAAARDGVRVYATFTHKLAATLPTLLPPGALCFSAESDRLFANTEGDRPDASVPVESWLYRWSLTGGMWKERWKQHVVGPSAGLAVSADGRWLALATVYACGYVFDQESGHLRRVFGEKANAMSQCAFARNDRALLTAGNSLRMWNLEAARPSLDRIESFHQTDAMRTERERAALVFKVTGMAPLVCVAPDGATAAAVGGFKSGGRAAELALVRLGPSPEIRVLDSNPDRWEKCSGIAFLPKGAAIAAAFGDGAVQLWDPTGSRAVRNVDSRLDGVQAMAVVPDAEEIALYTTGGFEVWNWAQNKRVWEERF